MFFHTVEKGIAYNVDSDTGAIIAGDAGLNHFGNDNNASDFLSHWPQIFPRADLYSKIFYSCILADLGNSAAENILTESELLKNYTKDFKEPTNAYDQNDPHADYMGPAFKRYDELVSSTGPLTINDSTIYAEYFCQVPQRKPIGSLIVAIIVADLVFLQALWKVLNWTTATWLEHSDSQSSYCKGCLALISDGHELYSVDNVERAENGSALRNRRPTLEAVRGRTAVSESRQPLVGESRVRRSRERESRARRSRERESRVRRSRERESRVRRSRGRESRTRRPRERD